jgi:CheY-like chemotaxis protein
VLVLDDDPGSQHVYERLLRDSEFQHLGVRSVREARAWMASATPGALVLDIQLQGEDAWNFLAEVREAPATRELPIVVVSNVDDQRKALALGADAYAPQPVEKEWLLDTLRRLAARQQKQVLIIDDDDATRYVLRGLCRQLGLVPLEATEGGDALARVARLLPGALVLDLVMPGLTGDVILGRLRADPATAALPVVITTSKVMEPGEREALEAQRAVVLSKTVLAGADALDVFDRALSRARLLADPQAARLRA